MVLGGLWRFYVSQGRIQKAHELGEQGFPIAQRMQDPVLLQEAHYMLGTTFFYLGELVSAHAHLEQVITLYDFRQNGSRAFNTGINAGVKSLSTLSWTLWTLGYPDQALTRINEALTLAQQLSHPYSLGFALHFAATLYQWCREVQRVQELSETAITLSSKHGFVRWLAGGMIKRGWSLAEQGSAEEAVMQLCQGLATWRAMGGELGLPLMLAMLAETYGKGGQAEEGLCVLDEVMTIVHKNAERYYEAEVYRLRGELLLQVNKSQEPRANS